MSKFNPGDVVRHLTNPDVLLVVYGVFDSSDDEPFEKFACEWFTRTGGFSVTSCSKPLGFSRGRFAGEPRRYDVGDLVRHRGSMGQLLVVVAMTSRRTATRTAKANSITSPVSGWTRR